CFHGSSIALYASTIPSAKLVDRAGKKQHQHDCAPPRIGVEPACQGCPNGYDDVDGEANNAADENAADRLPVLKVSCEPHNQPPRKDSRAKEPMIQYGASLGEIAEEQRGLYRDDQKGKRIKDRNNRGNR